MRRMPGVQVKAIDDLLRTLQVRLDAFAGCEIGRHWRLNVPPTNSVLCHFVLRGEGFLEAAGHRTAISPGTVIVVPPGTPKSISGSGEIRHEAEAQNSCVLHSRDLLAFCARDGDADLLLGCASISAVYAGNSGIFDHLAGPLIVQVGGTSSITVCFDALLEELSEPKIGTVVVAECLMKQILICVLRDRLQEILRVSSSGAGLGDPQLLASATAVLSHPEQNHSVASLAAVAGMSRTTFARRFSQQFEITPMEFVQQVRMRSAARLLQTTELPIKCLAAAVGYSSRSHFSRGFKNAFGLDPSSYRTKACGPWTELPPAELFRSRGGRDYGSRDFDPSSTSASSPLQTLGDGRQFV